MLIILCTYEVVRILSYRLGCHGCIQPHTGIHSTFMINIICYMYM